MALRREEANVEGFCTGGVLCESMPGYGGEEDEEEGKGVFHVFFLKIAGCLRRARDV